MNEAIPVFIGYDTSEHEAFVVAEHSLRAHTPNVIVTPLVQTTLRHMGLYRRAADREGCDIFDGRPFSTEFTFTRFLVPFLMVRHGWAMFCDCDFMFRRSIESLWNLRDDRYAVMVVKHDHRPSETVKMQGAEQTIYERKNWSSMVLWNCGHPAHHRLSLDDVNTRPGAWLHGFRWCEDGTPPERLVGGLPVTWNWLEGYSDPAVDPAVVHMTRGGPWFREWQDIAYADEWRQYHKEATRRNP